MIRLIQFALLVLLAGAVAATGATNRNVVLLIGDDQGLQVGCYGDRVIQTPSLDRLATQGTRFTNAFATVASCSASRSVILTGLFNHANGQYGHAHNPHNFYTFDQVQSLPRLLQGAGYRTAIVGKHHTKPATVYPFEQLPCPDGARSVTAMAEAARAFMIAEPDRPFLLVVGFHDAHRDRAGFANDQDYPGIKKITYRPEDIIVPPWLPDTAEARTELAEYYQSISRLDQGVGLMLDAIKASQHADDTLVIYVSDNGPPWPGAKTTLYEPGIHLPLLISTPAQKRRNVACEAMVSFVDITPTVLDWAGVQPPKEPTGRSLLPILEQDNPPGWDVVFGSHTFHEITMYYPMRMVRTRRYKYLLNVAHQLPFPFASDLWACSTWQGVLRRGDQRYGQRSVEAYLHRPAEELYDLSTDPNELRNLAGDPAQAAVLAELRQQLRQWQERTSDPWVVKHKHE